MPTPREMIDAQYGEMAAQRTSSWERGVIRSSSIGYDVRRLLMNLYPEQYPGEILQPRSIRVFERGDETHDRLRKRMIEGARLLGVPAADMRRIPAVSDLEEEWEIPLDVPVNNSKEFHWIIRGHPDGVLENLEWKGEQIGRALLEIKSAGSFGWKEVTAGKASPNYVAQATINMHALDCKATVFLYEAKDTQALHEFIIRYSAEEAQKLVDKATLVARLREQGKDPLTGPACAGEDYGWKDDKRSTKRIMGGTPNTFGRVLNWGCSYCPFWQHCHPSSVRILADNGKPVVIDAGEMQDEFPMIDHGTAVDPDPSWRKIGE